MATPIDPASAAFLLAESRQQPMHVGGLQLFERPEGAGPGYVREVFEQMRRDDQVAPLFLKHPERRLKAAGQLVWKRDDLFDIEHHVRHSALPEPGGSASCSSCAPGCTPSAWRGSGRCGRPT